MNRVSTAAAHKIPTLPAAAKRAGATKIQRTTGSTFVIGYRLTEDDPGAPGNGPAVFAALERAWSDRADVTWGGRQVDPVIARFH